MKEGEPFCCYDCTPCPEGKFSEQEDMNDCSTCTDKTYPSNRQDFCIPKLIYGPAPVMNDKTTGLSFYQMSPKDALQHAGILTLLLHFNWTWIGILTSNDEYGERFVQTVFPVFSRK
ncbi:vomeronasal type-2 receptor 26-like, partial [Podarcis lilfordi]